MTNPARPRTGAPVTAVGDRNQSASLRRALLVLEHVRDHARARARAAP
ncbi:hypothetical protein ACU686_04525 [Yinghuangia aomiensis]